MSAPVIKDKRVVAHINNNLMQATAIAERPKKRVIGNSSWSGVLISNATITEYNMGASKRRSGDVNAAKKGSTAPILTTSVNAVRMINNSNNPNCFLRLGVK